MVKSATEAGSLPTFHYMDEVEVDGLLELRRLLKDDPALDGEALHNDAVISDGDWTHM
jgi:hypothetical protein